jgi:hypothetical protein
VHLGDGNDRFARIPASMSQLVSAWPIAAAVHRGCRPCRSRREALRETGGEETERKREREREREKRRIRARGLHPASSFGLGGLATVKPSIILGNNQEERCQAEATARSACERFHQLRLIVSAIVIHPVATRMKMNRRVEDDRPPRVHVVFPSRMRSRERSSRH